MQKQIQREYLTVIMIMGGIITLIESDGSIGYYRQRGMTRIPQIALSNMIRRGVVDANWRDYKELPKHYTISYENQELMGKAMASFKVG